MLCQTPGIRVNRRQACIALAGAATAIAGGSFAQSEVLQRRLGRGKRESLLIGSAGAMMSLNKALAREFMQRHPLLTVVIEQGGSLPAYIAASRKAIDLAAMTRALSDSEDDASAHHYLIAKGNIGIIVNHASQLTNLSQEQIRALLTGEIANWKLVGGPDRQVNVYSRTRGSTTRQYAEAILLDGSDFSSGANDLESAAALSAAVAADPYAIGYIASKDKSANADVACLAVDGVHASRSTVLSGRYPYTHTFHLLLYGEQAGARSDFVGFARSAPGQNIVAQEGLIPVC